MKPRYTFKSSEPFFTKERLDLKNNTVREIDLNEDKFLDLIFWMMNGYNDGDLEVEIIPAYEKGKGFVRDIKDISVYNNLMIITWTAIKPIK